MPIAVSNVLLHQPQLSKPQTTKLSPSIMFSGMTGGAEEDDGKLYLNNLDAAEAAARALKTVWTPAATSLPMIGGKPVVLARNTVPQNLLKLEKGFQDTLLDPKKQSKLGKKIVGGTSVAKWTDMPTPTLTPELKKQFQLLKVRSAMDPKRHYKANDTKGIPTHFQVGTVIEGNTEFYSGRLTKKERKQTFADELLANSQLKSFRKRKYTEIQEEKGKGGKKFYKQKKNRQKSSWAKT